MKNRFLHKNLPWCTTNANTRTLARIIDCSTAILRSSGFNGQVPVTSSKLGAAHAWNGFFTRVLDQSRAERVDVNNFPIKRPRRGGPTPHCLRNTGMLTPGTTHSHAPDQQPTTNPNQPNDGQSINGQRANPNCVPATTLFALSLTTRRPLFGGW